MTREGGSGRTTRIWPSEKLLEYFREARFSSFEIQDHEGKECIVLRNEEGDDLEYVDTAETQRMRAVLSPYNHLLRTSHIDCCHLDESYVLKKDGVPIPINQSRKTVRRIFNNSSWTQGGRFYGGWWQQVGEEHRQGIRIDGERTIEIDYSGLHIVLLYAQKGINYFHEYGYAHDPYDITVPEINDPDVCRWLAKQIILIGVNAQDEASTLSAVRLAARKDPLKPLNLPLTNSVLRPILDQLRAKHTPIADMLCSGASIELQLVDGQMTENIIQHFTNLQVPVLTIHDSYVISENYAEDLHIQMQEAWKKATSLANQISEIDKVFGLRESLETTKVKQLGYIDELEVDDPKEHERIMREKEGQYVSPRYRDGLTAFREWLENTKTA